VVASTLATVGASFHDIALIATRESERAAELGALSPLLVAAPMLDRDVNDVADLLELAAGFSS
jgi:stalled ribosome rescue protein Dom34